MKRQELGDPRHSQVTITSPTSFSALNVVYTLSFTCTACSRSYPFSSNSARLYFLGTIQWPDEGWLPLQRLITTHPSPEESFVTSTTRILGWPPHPASYSTHKVISTSSYPSPVFLTLLFISSSSCLYGLACPFTSLDLAALEPPLHAISTSTLLLHHIYFFQPLSSP